MLASFIETRAPTSGKHGAEQGIVMANPEKTFQTFWLHSPLFALERQPKNLTLQSFFYL